MPRFKLPGIQGGVVMVPLYERRHRISPTEIPYVLNAIEAHLIRLVETGIMTMDTEHLFRLWWRIKTHRQGRPDYPDPLTLKIIRKYLTGEAMVPFEK